MGWPITRPSTIYAIRCKKTSRVYIGRTYRLEFRIKEHFRELRKGQKTFYSYEKFERHPSNFQKDYNKYGEESFEVYILEENVPPEKCKEKEASWIEIYHSTNPLYGYNRHDEKEKINVPTPKMGPPPNRYAQSHRTNNPR